MPELSFRIKGVEPVQHGLVPLLHFKLEIEASSEAEPIQGLLLQAQIQIQAPQRAYNAAEKERLRDIFGTADLWGQTLRNRFWIQTSAVTGAFTGRTETVLPVPCTFDVNVLATKYFQALGEGDIPLLFLFSGTIFYDGPERRLQAQRIAWDKECVYRMRLEVWKGLMDAMYPNSAWLLLRRDVFGRLDAFKRARGLATWEETIEWLLPELEFSEAVP